MNDYNSYTGGRKKKVLKKLLVVFVSVLIIIGATVVLGNYLKKRAERAADGGYTGIGRDDIAEGTEVSEIIIPSESGLGVSDTVSGLCVPLRMGDDGAEENSFEARLAEAAKDHTGVLIPLTGDDGFLLYNSVRAGEYSRLPVNPTIPDMAELCSAVSAARSEGLRVSAYIRSSVSLGDTEEERELAIAADSRIAADAAEAGFDEIIIGSLIPSPESITGESSRVVLRYLNQMTAAAGDTEVGLSLPYSVYKVATLSPQIELFVSRSVFLTMELTTEQSTEEYVNYICENLAGTLSVYNMRMLLAPADVGVAEAITQRLAAIGHKNYLYTSVPEESVENMPDETGDVTDTVDETGSE